jgi:hypothetical protein
MNDEAELNLDTDHLEEVIEAPPASQPVVVIQYRNRGVPWSRVVVLLAMVAFCSAGLYHRLSSRRRSYDPPPARTEGTVAPSPAPAKDASEVVLALNSQPLSPAAAPALASPSPSTPAAPSKPPTQGPATAPLPKPEKSAEAASPKVEAAKPDSTQPKTEPSQPKAEPSQPRSQPAPESRSSAAPIFVVRAPSQDDANPFAELDISRTSPGEPDPRPSSPPQDATPDTQVADNRPAPTKDELLRDIKAEAAEKRQELNQIRNLKDRARDELAAQAQDQVEDERVTFRRELDEILHSKSRTAGQEINTLCDKYGRNYDPALKEKVSRAFRLTSNRMTTEGKMSLLRRYGVPEPGILDFLANEIAHGLLGSRNGPRTPDQVRVLAARRLIDTRLTKSPRGASRAAQDPDEGATDAARPAPAGGRGR